MSNALQHYRALSARLAAVRDAQGGEDSPEEDQVLDEMDVALLEMTKAERDTVDRGEMDANPRLD